MSGIMAQPGADLDGDDHGLAAMPGARPMTRPVSD
jgi:hypothetical protein